MIDRTSSAKTTRMTDQKETPPLDPSEIECWIFDLDNTLYPAASNLFERVAARITEFIKLEFDLGDEQATKLRRHTFRKHGTTLRGLMLEHNVDPERYLDYVHDIDVSDVAPDQPLTKALGRLPGRKIIYTNGSHGHAERIMKQIGVAAHFEGIFDIMAGDYVPKPNPEPYNRMIERFAIQPSRSVMIEDMAKNLVPAAALGMTTVWLRHDADWASDGAEGDHVHHICDDLVDWLESLF